MRCRRRSAPRSPAPTAQWWPSPATAASSSPCRKLGTAVELGLPLPILIWNNDAFGQIAQNMRDFGIEEVAVRPRNPDFQILAKAYGANAAKPESLAGITRPSRRH